MRIVQIIDSLEIGGAEKMAVNYANALSVKMDFSGLISTRKEGQLKNTIYENVNYFFLNKKHRLDLIAVFKLRKYCVNNKISYIQAHSSSFFIACLVKVLLPKIKIIWHDHNGIGIIPVRKGTSYLKMFSVFFYGVIAVNNELADWSKKHLFCNKVIYLQNFVKVNSEYVKSTHLLGQEGKRVLYLANLRHQKNHFLFLEVIKKTHINFPEWTYHLVGNDREDEYSNKLKLEIRNNNLENVVFIYGSKQDIEHIINQSDIAVFTSNSEGLPVSLLEYGIFKKPVVSTNVGEIPFIIENNKSGFICKVKDGNTFSENLQKLMNDKLLRNTFGENLHKIIIQNYSEETVISKYLNWI